MELKLENPTIAPLINLSSNRTFMELKYEKNKQRPYVYMF